VPTLAELAEQAKSSILQKNAPTHGHEEELLAIPKGDRSVIVLRRLTQSGQDFFDIRVFVFRAGEGRFVPTPKGVRLTSDQFRVLADYLCKKD